MTKWIDTAASIATNEVLHTRTAVTGVRNAIATRIDTAIVSDIYIAADNAIRAVNETTWTAGSSAISNAVDEATAGAIHIIEARS